MLKATVRHGLTRAEPFKFVEREKKRKAKDASPDCASAAALGYQFKTMGELVFQFSTKSPARFHAATSAAGTIVFKQNDTFVRICNYPQRFSDIKIAWHMISYWLAGQCGCLPATGYS